MSTLLKILMINTKKVTSIANLELNNHRSLPLTFHSDNSFVRHRGQCLYCQPPSTSDVSKVFKQTSPKTCPRTGSPKAFLSRAPHDSLTGDSALALSIDTSSPYSSWHMGHMSSSTTLRELLWPVHRRTWQSIHESRG